jgi:hypothetical protein
MILIATLSPVSVFVASRTLPFRISTQDQINLWHAKKEDTTCYSLLCEGSFADHFPQLILSYCFRHLYFVNFLSGTLGHVFLHTLDHRIICCYDYAKGASDSMAPRQRRREGSLRRILRVQPNDASFQMKQLRIRSGDYSLLSQSTTALQVPMKDQIFSDSGRL